MYGDAQITDQGKSETRLWHGLMQVRNFLMCGQSQRHACAKHHVAAVEPIPHQDRTKVENDIYFKRLIKAAVEASTSCTSPESKRACTSFAKALPNSTPN
jgi:hypothetical protein